MSDTPVAPSLPSIISGNNGPVGSGAERFSSWGALGELTPARRQGGR